MAEFARVQTSTNAVQEIRDFGAGTPQPLAIPHKNIDWRPVTRVTPAFDSATQTREGPVTTVYADRVEIVWTVRAKTPAELDEIKDAAIGAIDERSAMKALAAALYAVVNEVRALKGQTTLSPAQYRAWLKSLL